MTQNHSVTPPLLVESFVINLFVLAIMHVILFMSCYYKDSKMPHGFANPVLPFSWKISTNYVLRKCNIPTSHVVSPLDILVQGIMRSLTSCSATDMERLFWFSLLLNYLTVTGKMSFLCISLHYVHYAFRE